MSITVGIDVGTGAVKAVVMDCSGEPKLLAHETRRIRKRAISAVVDEVLGQVLEASGVDQVDYIGSTGDGEEIPYTTGHFYGMTTHARGALFLEPRARAVLDIGALHARAVAMDERGKVLDYKMTSQCASGRASSSRTSRATSGSPCRRSARSPCRRLPPRTSRRSVRCSPRPT